MGEMVMASCRCGYSSDDLFIGGGMVNYETYCGVPASCRTCERMQSVNVFDPPAPCSTCGGPLHRYTEPEPQATAAHESAEARGGWQIWRIGERRVTLPRTARCPRCDERSLHFAHVGLWD